MTVAILPNPGNSDNVHRLSVEAYHALGEMGYLGKNTELLYGIVFTKMPKSPLHAHLTRRLLEFVRAAIRSSHFVMSEQPITCTDSEPEPDVSVVAGRMDDFARQHPKTAELVIEVAVTSEEYDRNKALAYARAGVKEFWLVLANSREIEIRRKPGADGFADVSRVVAGGVAESGAVPGVRVDVAALFAR